MVSPIAIVVIFTIIWDSTLVGLYIGCKIFIVVVIVILSGCGGGRGGG